MIIDTMFEWFLRGLGFGLGFFLVIGVLLEFHGWLYG